jgi:serine/threonine protein kinase
MQLLRSYGSVIRKAHLSLDVALGIEALHACGLVHGDIKPSNIIVQKHPTRTIVAKLTDFNGVSPANTYGSSTYSFGTPSWQPPEVLLNEESIDWQLGDVYSYGMVFATIWCKTGFIPVGGSFLDPVCKYELDRDAKRSMLELYKYAPDDEDDSVIKLALCSAAVEEQELAFSPASVITCTLSTLPPRRRPLSMILSSHFVEFSKRTNRKIP